MTFVAQKLTQQLAAPYLAKLRSPVHQIQTVYVIDSERNIAMLDLGGHGDIPKTSGQGPSYYALFWHELEISISTWYQFDSSGGSTVLEYKDAVAEVPAALNVPVEEIRQVFADALHVYWEKLNRRPVPVRVSFDTVVHR